MGVKMDNCCGFSLKHGTIIIGVLQSILAFIALVLLAAYAENPREFIAMLHLSIVPDLAVVRCILIIMSVKSALQCIFSILLIFAAKTNRPSLIVPWLTFISVSLAVYILGNLGVFIHHTHLNMTTPFIVGHLLFALIITLIVLHQVLVVWNFYKHLKSLNF